MSEVLAQTYSPEIEEANAGVIDLESIRRKRRDRQLGRTAISGEQRVRNNDALAHVFLAQHAIRRGAGFAEIDNQVRAEYRYDMGERDDNKEFYDHFDFRVVGNDLLSETGLLM